MENEDFDQPMWSQMLDEVCSSLLFLHANMCRDQMFTKHANTYVQALAAVVDETIQVSLPDCSFIETNQPVARNVPLTTATKKGKAIVNRKAAVNKTNKGGVKKIKASKKTKAAEAHKPAE